VWLVLEKVVDHFERGRLHGKRVVGKSEIHGNPFCLS
jgi:hypothetical protein